MRVLDRIIRSIGGIPKRDFAELQSQVKKLSQRRYDAAIVNRLTNDWSTSKLSADAEVFTSIQKAVDRSRQLERDNDYARNYFRSRENNILGHCGIALQMKVKDGSGKLDTAANKLIEDGWKKWGGAKFCTVAEDSTWLDVQKLILRSTDRDGNVFIRRLKGYENPFRYSLQLLEADHLDIDYTRNLPNGNTVRMGVEFDSQRRRVAYHFLSDHPGDAGFSNSVGRRRVAVPASEITHVFTPERIRQTLGMPQLCSSMRRLNMLAGYEEAELVASRTGACKMGFIEQSLPEDAADFELDKSGNPITEGEPGTIERLGMGQSFKPWDPQHPNSQYGGFIKSCLRAIAAGLGIAYHNLANDLEGVNYSSARIGMLEERENWKTVQAWFIQHVCTPIFEDWLEMALLTRSVNLPAEKFDKFNSPEWKGRRWTWVDPEKEVNAQVTAIKNRLTSHRAVIAEQGGDSEDVFEDCAADEKLAAEKGIELSVSEKAETVEPPEAEAPEE